MRCDDNSRRQASKNIYNNFEKYSKTFSRLDLVDEDKRNTILDCNTGSQEWL